MCLHSAASGAARCRSHTTRSLDPATHGGVTEVCPGIFSGWVTDPLGYTLSDPLRERTDLPAPPERGLAIATPSAKRSSGEHSRGTTRAGSLDVVPSLYGPLPRADVSPVFEWRSCLWQWRPLHVSAVTRGSAAVELELEALSKDVGHEPLPSTLLHQHAMYFQALFLLCPTHELFAMRPLLHTAVVDGIQAGLRAQHGSTGSITGIRLPTPVGGLELDCTHGRVLAALHDGNNESPIFALLGLQPYADAAAARLALPPPAPPAAETWEAVAAEAASGSTEKGSGGDAGSAAPYTHVFAEDRAPAQRTHACCSPVIRARRNAIGGGLAALLLAVDRYAALVARGDLTLSAACWATLCDSTSAEVVQLLRVNAPAVERELLMATAAHRRWHEHARARNRTLVGKSSHDVTCSSYPAAVQWPPQEIPRSE